jgi:hypothetical protein
VAAVHAAPTWQHLPALHALYLQQDEASLGPAHSLLLLKGLAAATSLTRLHNQGYLVDESVPLCVHLTGLTRLQDMDIHDAYLASRADALHLTALTSLTRLEVSGAPGLDDTAASAVALCLKQLQELRLISCALRSAAALPSIATLTGLTSLCLCLDSWAQAVGELPLGRDELVLLTPLAQLQTTRFDNFFSKDAVDELWNKSSDKWKQPKQNVQQ